jgi:hypothetical protein
LLKSLTRSGTRIPRISISSSRKNTKARLRHSGRRAKRRRGSRRLKSVFRWQRWARPPSRVYPPASAFGVTPISQPAIRYTVASRSPHGIIRNGAIILPFSPRALPGFAQHFECDVCLLPKLEVNRSACSSSEPIQRSMVSYYRRQYGPGELPKGDGGIGAGIARMVKILQRCRESHRCCTSLHPTCGDGGAADRGYGC